MPIFGAVPECKGLFPRLYLIGIALTITLLMREKCRGKRDSSNMKLFSLVSAGPCHKRKSRLSEAENRIRVTAGGTLEMNAKQNDSIRSTDWRV
jgi:hypothetical protein